MTEMSIRERILTALIVRASQMRTEYGYNTDCGGNALRSIKMLDFGADGRRDDFPCIVMWPQQETRIATEYNIETFEMPVSFELFERTGTAHAGRC